MPKPFGFQNLSPIFPDHWKNRFVLCPIDFYSWKFLPFLFSFCGVRRSAGCPDGIFTRRVKVFTRHVKRFTRLVKILPSSCVFLVLVDCSGKSVAADPFPAAENQYRKPKSQSGISLSRPTSVLYRARMVPGVFLTRLFLSQTQMSVVPFIRNKPSRRPLFTV